MASQALTLGEDAKPSLRNPFSDRRLGAMVVLGFSSGLPFLLVYITQSAWLSEAKVPIGLLGLMSEMTLAYKFKFLWAPFLDRYDAPLLSRLLGRRRGWIVLSQIGVMLTLAGVAFGDPAQPVRRHRLRVRLAPLSRRSGDAWRPWGRRVLAVRHRGQHR